MSIRKLTKLLSLSVLAFVSAMAINASAAQALYVLAGGTQHSSGVLLLHLNATYLLKEFLIVPLGVHIHCLGGTGLVLYQTNAAMTTLLRILVATFTHCLTVGFASCTVRTPGQAAGVITMSGSGNAHMSGTETLATMASENFSTIAFEGALCPFNEVEGTINGEMSASLPNGEELAETKLGTSDDVSGSLFFGEEECLIHGVNLSTPVLVHYTKVGGGTWAIKLTGL